MPWQHTMNTANAAYARKPSTAFLVSLNALVFLVLVLQNLSPLLFFFILPVSAIFLGLSGFWQKIWLALDRRFRFHNIVRCAGFVLPVSALVILPHLGLNKAPRPLNQKCPATSRTGEHLAYVVAKPDGWTVEIQGENGDTLHREQTNFARQSDLYWIWGGNERLWIYNNDDDRVHCWYHEDGNGWRRVLWGHGFTKEADVEFGPPRKELFPRYARERLEVTESMNELKSE